MAKPVPPLNVLFVCTGNSARSILAEAFMNSAGRGRFRGHSAGSHPVGSVDPRALKLLEQNHIRTEGLRSKSWDEFARPGAPRMEFVFTLCEDAADEVCPTWQGRPITAHWDVPDPVVVGFGQAFNALSARIRLFMDLPFERLERRALEGVFYRWTTAGMGKLS